MISADIFTWGGKRYCSGDLSVLEIEELETATRTRYGALIPRLEMGHRVAYMRLFLSKDNPPDVVEKTLNTMTGKQSEDAWSVDDNDMPEMYEEGVPTAGGPSIPTS